MHVQLTWQPNDDQLLLNDLTVRKFTITHKVFARSPFVKRNKRSVGCYIS